MYVEIAKLTCFVIFHEESVYAEALKHQRNTLLSQARDYQ